MGMSQTPFVQFYIGDYLAKTRHLSCEEHGAYLQMLFTAWTRKDCQLPFEFDFLAKITGLTVRKFKAIWPTLSEFWDDENGYLVNHRLQEERKKTEEKREKRVEAGRAGGNAKALKTLDPEPSKAKAMLYHSSEPEPYKKKITKKKKVSEHPEFKNFKSAYPERDGVQNWTVASNRFTELIEAEEATAESLIAAARRYSSSVQKLKESEKSFIQQASTFLGPKKQTWREFLPSATEKPKRESFEIFKGTPEWEAWKEHDKPLKWFERDGQSGSQDWWELSRVLKPSKFPEQERKSA